MAGRWRAPGWERRAPGWERRRVRVRRLGRTTGRKWTHTRARGIAPERGWTHAHLDSCAVRPEDFGFLWGARGHGGGGSAARAAGWIVNEFTPRKIFGKWGE